MDVVNAGVNSSFVGKLGECRTLLKFAKAIGSERGSVVFYVDDNGLKMSTEEAKSIQANAFLQRDLFQVFQFKANANDRTKNGDEEEEDAELGFEMSMCPLIEGLSLLGPVGDHVLWLRHLEDKLALYVEENGVVVEMKLATRHLRQPMDLEFGVTADVVVKIIIGGVDNLKDILADLDTTSPEVRLCVCPEKRTLTLHTAGNAGSMRIDIPADSSLISHFEVAERVVCSYKSSHLRTCLKPLSMAEKLSLRVDARRILCLQYMVKVEEHKAFLEFLCLPLEDDDDD